MDPTKTSSCFQEDGCTRYVAKADESRCSSGYYGRGGIRKGIIRCYVWYGRDGGCEQSGNDDLVKGKHTM